MEYFLVILAFIGLLFSGYAYLVKWKWQSNKKYKPWCDISDKVSCTKAFSSTYGFILGISNSLYGIFFYALIAFLAFQDKVVDVFILSLVAVCLSAYLSYLSYVKVRNVCVVCTAIYLLNLLFLAVSGYALFA